MLCKFRRKWVWDSKRQNTWSLITVYWWAPTFQSRNMTPSTENSSLFFDCSKSLFTFCGRIELCSGKYEIALHAIGNFQHWIVYTVLRKINKPWCWCHTKSNCIGDRVLRTCSIIKIQSAYETHCAFIN